MWWHLLSGLERRCSHDKIEKMPPVTDNCGRGVFFGQERVLKFPFLFALHQQHNQRQEVFQFHPQLLQCLSDTVIHRLR